MTEAIGTYLVINTKKKRMDVLNYFHCKKTPKTSAKEIEKIRLINVILRRRPLSNMSDEVELKPIYLSLKKRASML